MEKYYCPYCGERSLSAHQKFAGKKWFGPAAKTTNKLWFSCPCCGKEVNKRTEGKGKTIDRFIIPSFIVFAVLVGVLLALKLYTLMYCAMALAVIFEVIISVVAYKYSIFTRMDANPEDDVIARANIDLKGGFTEEQIYIIRAKYKNKVNVDSRYIAALSNYSREDSTCDVRFIKPLEAEGLIAACQFEVYDDDKFVGKGEFIE